ncbi:hypothetical protein [Candidatus Spongiihabitans sp.]
MTRAIALGFNSWIPACGENDGSFVFRHYETQVSAGYFSLGKARNTA